MSEAVDDNRPVQTPAALGLDVFSLRSQGLSAVQILEFCAARGVGVVHFSEPRLLGPAGAGALRRGARLR